MIAALRRLLTPTPPPPPWEAIERELAVVAEEVARLRPELDAATDELLRTGHAYQVALDRYESSEGDARGALQALQEARRDREVAGDRYEALRDRWPPLRARERDLRARARILRVIES